MHTIFSILSIYIFIMLGFFAKHSFKDKLNEKSLVYISIYFLQPFLILWGFSSARLDFGILKAPFIFLGLVLIFLLISYLLSIALFRDEKDRSIFIVTSIVGNTGNLGIPLGLMLYGESSVIYTTFINIVNIFLVYIVGVYFYSRGSFSIKDSIKNIFKLPAIWFTSLAIVLNISGFSYPKELELPLKMGAYSAMVVQLFIFGMYLKSVKIGGVDLKLGVSVSLFKFLLIPILSIFILNLFSLEKFVKDIIFLELIVPIGVMNVNLAALYNCKPQKVAFLTFLTSVVFMILIYFIVR